MWLRLPLPTLSTKPFLALYFLPQTLLPQLGGLSLGFTPLLRLPWLPLGRLPLLLLLPLHLLATELRRMLPFVPQPLIAQTLQLPLIPRLPSVSRVDDGCACSRDPQPQALADPAGVSMKEFRWPSDHKDHCHGPEGQDRCEGPRGLRPTPALTG